MIKINIYREVQMQGGNETRKAFGQAGVFFRKADYFCNALKGDGKYRRLHPFLEISYQCLMKGGLSREEEVKYAKRLADYGARKSIAHRWNEEGRHWIQLDDTLNGILEIMKANKKLSRKAERVFAEFIYAISGYRNEYAVDALKLVKGKRQFNLLVEAVCSRCEDGGVYSREKRDLLCRLLAGEGKFFLNKKQQVLVANAIAKEKGMKRYDAQDALEKCNGNLCEKAKKILEKTARAQLDIT